MLGRNLKLGGKSFSISNTTWFPFSLPNTGLLFCESLRRLRTCSLAHTVTSNLWPSCLSLLSARIRDESTVPSSVISFQHESLSPSLNKSPEWRHQEAKCYQGVGSNRNSNLAMPVARTFNPKTRRQRQKDFCKFNDSLAYRACPRPVKATLENPVSK